MPQESWNLEESVLFVWGLGGRFVIFPPALQPIWVSESADMRHELDKVYQRLSATRIGKFSMISQCDIVSCWRQPLELARATQRDLLRS